MMKFSDTTVRLLFLLVMFAIPNADAQISSYRFQYKEVILSDYSAIMNTGRQDTKRMDSSLHNGIVTVKMLSNDSLLLHVKTETFSRSNSVQLFPQSFVMLGKLDAMHRLKEIHIQDSIASHIQDLIMWISEINFHLPGSGVHVEQKMDGDFETEYINHAQAGKNSLSKTVPRYLPGGRSNQAILFDKYSNESVFDKTGVLETIRLIDEKRQVLGRRTLACIKRSFNLSRVSEIISVTVVNRNGLVSFSLYQRLSTHDRRVQLARTLLGRETLATLQQKLVSANKMSNEEQFRLKSMLRSMLILDSSVFSAMHKTLDRFEIGLIQFDIIENAIIECHTSHGMNYINEQITANLGNYERLKDIIIKATTANSFTGEIAENLLQILSGSTNQDLQSLISLALSNYALTIRNTDLHAFERITNNILLPYRDNPGDTLHYLFIVGNAGIEKESLRLLKLLITGKKKDVVFAFRHFRNDVADSVIKDFILHSADGVKEIRELFSNRILDSVFSMALISKIIQADRRGDTSNFPLLQYLLDKRHEVPATIEFLLAQKFEMDVYRKEIDEFIERNELCTQGPNR